MQKTKTRKKLFAFHYVFYLIKTSTKIKTILRMSFSKKNKKRNKIRKKNKIDHLIIFVIFSVPHTLNNNKKMWAKSFVSSSPLLIDLFTEKRRQENRLKQT